MLKLVGTRAREMELLFGKKIFLSARQGAG
jgi:hypothetical protein